MGEWLYLIIAIAVLAIALVAGLLVRGRGKPPTAPTAPTTPGTPTADAPPEAPTEASAGAPAPTVEKPESTSSRLVRLRQRLSGSQGGFGKGLLALLSRDRLDEDTWEAIEDTLLTADVGVEPTQQVVEALRTRLRVEGTTEDPRSVLREELLKIVDPTLGGLVEVN